jgi:hypothetical protein
MWVNGVLAVPHDNIGADFQMATRSSKGDAYNPTQGGDCMGIPSVLKSVTPNWNAVDPNASAPYGILLDIDPRNYNQPPTGCLGFGAVLPYDMRFGVMLGDGSSMPRELMILDMSIRKDAGSAAEDIVKALSELPVIYLDNTIFRYAYYSIDANPVDGIAFQSMRMMSSSGVTNDTQLWPVLVNYNIAQPAHSIMLCDRADAVELPALGQCVALYAHEGATVWGSRRTGARHQLTLITAIIDNQADPLITDYAFHVQRRLIAVGNPNTVSAGIAWAEAHLKPEDWRQW